MFIFSKVPDFENKFIHNVLLKVLKIHDFWEDCFPKPKL